MTSGAALLRTISGPAPDISACKYPVDYNSTNALLPPLSTVIKAIPAAVGMLHPGLQVVIKLIILNAMRASECLGITARDQVKPSMFLVHGRKRSHDYLIHIPLSPASQAVLKQAPGKTPLFPWTYLQLYRAMVRVGCSQSVFSRVNDVVTHQGRYTLAEKLIALNEQDAVSPLLHHKAKSSAGYYIRGGRKQ